jgi:lipopolysaccharide assembly protein A
MRILVWLARAVAFFALFGFALNNLHEVTLFGFFGAQWRGPLVLVVLAALALGCAIGALALLPSWWRHRSRAQGDPAGTTILDAPEAEPALPQGALTHPPRDGL